MHLCAGQEETPPQKAVLLPELSLFPFPPPSWRGLGGVFPSFACFFTHFLSFSPKDPDILNGVYMSEALNPIFVDNFERDPTLTWQYFGSSTGFFRLYPGKRAAISLTPSAQSRTGAEPCQSPTWEAWGSSTAAVCPGGPSVKWLRSLAL